MLTCKVLRGFDGAPGGQRARRGDRVSLSPHTAQSLARRGIVEIIEPAAAKARKPPANKMAQAPDNKVGKSPGAGKGKRSSASPAAPASRPTTAPASTPGNNPDQGGE